ncbi:MAG: ROK family protein [Chloroflexota bacterium]
MKTNDNISNLLAMGIEIGGTKIQVGIGFTSGKLLRPPIRKQVVRANGADGIRRDIVSMVEDALASTELSLSDIHKIGIGFGGVLDSNQGSILRSYQIAGWDDFPLQKWAEENWGKPVVIQNDAGTAGLAEALHGSGRGCSRIFYMTIGSGIGGGWIVDGKIDGGQGLGSAEIGHTWVPDPVSGIPTELEQICSGWAIGHRARLAAENNETLMLEMAGSLSAMDAKIVYAAAEDGDELARRILHETCQTLGIAISNVVALLHPQRVILGGGVSLMGSLFWNPLRKEAMSRVLPAFASGVEILRAGLGEDVVVIGALCL